MLIILSHYMLFYLHDWPWGNILETKELHPRIWRKYLDQYFLSRTGKRFFKQSIETINAFHPTIIFTAEWSEKKMSILDVNVRLRNWSLETDLHIKPTGTIQFLDSTSCHSYHCKKSLPYSQILSSRRIYSDVETFDQHCYGLKKWIKERSYGE